MNGAVRSNGGREAEEEAEWLSVVPGSVIEGMEEDKRQPPIGKPLS